MNLQIVPARPVDLEPILRLQKQAYQSEAAIYQDFNIPPLTETLAMLQVEQRHSLVLAAWAEGELVGAVRGEMKEDSCLIGRLLVAPSRQNQGIGKALMKAIEAAHPQARRFELFTGTLSLKNLALYQALGYQPFRQEMLGQITFIYLEKRASQPGQPG